MIALKQMHISLLFQNFVKAELYLMYFQKKKKLPEEEAIFILYQIVSAIDFIGQNKVVHRDIKPENILVSKGVYKLADFGFASQKQLYQTHLGTYPYMAPEFFNSQDYDSGVDVWALGILFHQMLFGEIYFMGNSQYEVSQKILNLPYQLKQGQNTSDVMKEILFAMIEKDRKKRITASELLSHRIFDQIKQSNQIETINKLEQEFMGRFLQDANQENQLVNEFKQLEINNELQATSNEQQEQIQVILLLNYYQIQDNS